MAFWGMLRVSPIFGNTHLGLAVEQGFRVEGLRAFRVYGSEGSGFWVYGGLGFRVEGLRVLGSKGSQGGTLCHLTSGSF